MLIDIRASAGLSVDKLRDSFEANATPALLVDDKMKIAYKSSAAAEFALGFKTGAPISRFISEEAAYDLMRLAPNESFCTTADTGYSRCGVIFIGCNFCKIALLSPFFADMLGCVDDEYGRMSGYDIKISGDLLGRSELAGRSDTRMHKMSKFLSETISGLKDIHGLPYFNATSVLNTILESAGNIHGVSRDIFDFDKTAGEVIICGSQRNFALVLAAVVSFCVNSLSEGKIHFHLSVSESEMTLTVSAMLGASSYKTRIAPSFSKDGNSSGINMQNASFWIYLSKLLADANLWSINVDSPENAQMLFSLNAPLLPAGNELTVRDFADSELMDMLEAVFAFLIK